MNMYKDLLEEAIEAINKDGGSIHEASHYTNVVAFENMVQTIHNIDSKPFFRFWFTDAYCTNDKTEASFGYDFMINAFSAIESCLYSKEDRFLITNYEGELEKSKKYKQYTPDKIRSLLTHEEATPYIMSLTRKTDDIDTWLKVYGDGGKGICMVFDFSDMDKYRYQSDFCIHGQCIDPKGELYRYPYEIGKDGNKLTSSLPSGLFEIKTLKETMIKVYRFLDGINSLAYEVNNP